VTELRRSFAISHLPLSYPLAGWIRPFVVGQIKAADNIDDRHSFCETRAHYWLWRNVRFDEDEFVAVQQYRRCFWLPELARGERFAPLAARAEEEPTPAVSREEFVAYVGQVGTADPAPLNDALRGVDVVVCRRAEYHRSIAEEYCSSHRKADWDIFAAVCARFGLGDGSQHWFVGHGMFMMKPTLFRDYMDIWWRVMSEVDKLVTHENDSYQFRKMAFLSERFLNLWLGKLLTDYPNTAVRYLPVVESKFDA
jgi:hypothetical protein